MSSTSAFFKRTRSIFLWTRLLNIPFWTIYNMLFIILYKELHATPLQIATIIALKPLASLFSPYWSLPINKRKDRLISNLVWANILKFAPFLLFPWMKNAWLFIFSFGFYMIFVRGVIPAWMEIIKLNIQGKLREKTYAFGAMMDYVGSAILPIALGWVLDDYPDSWKWIFFGTAAVGIFSTSLLPLLPLKADAPAEIDATPLPPRPNFKEIIFKPWKQAWDLLKARPDFAQFQWGFMLGGGALIMMHTVLPMLFVDVLDLSYTKIMLAIACCKGIGFAISSPSWVKLFHRLNIFSFCSWVTLCAAFFPICLLTSYFHLSGLFLAYLLYGVMQAGSELSWHMSGPYFSGQEDSSTYSGTNVLTVGVRGSVVPLVGHLLYSVSNSLVVMGVACLLCVAATIKMRRYSHHPRRLLSSD